MKRRPKTPTWILSDEFGIDRDKYNWTLYVRNGDGDTTRWKALSYHPTPALLLSELYRRVERTIPAHHGFTHHLEVAADRAHSLYSEFLERINTKPSVMTEATSFSPADKERTT